MEAAAIRQLNIDKTNWTPVKFGDVVFEPKENAKDLFSEGIEHVVGLEHIDSENIHLTRSGKPEDSTTFSKKFKKGDVLFGRRRAYLKKAAVASFDGICSGDITVFRAKKNLLPELLPFVVNNEKFFDYAVKHSAGGLSPRVKFKDLANYEFLLPPKDQQAQLAELLWALDEVVEKERGVLEKSIICRYVFFENKLSKSINEVRTLGYVINDIVAGKSPMGQNRPAFNDEYGVLKVSAVGKEEFVDSENKALVDQSEFNMRYEVKPGYILVTRANALFEGIGRACMVKKTRNGLMLSDKTLRIIPNNEYVLDRFLYQCLLSRPFRSYVESVAGGTEAKNISQDNLRNAPIWKPSIQIQSEIVKKLEAFDNVILDKQVQILHSRALQKSLINEIF